MPNRKFRARLAPGPASDDGFSLAEVMVAMGIVVVVCLAAAPVFYKAAQSTHGVGLRETAVSVINQRLDAIRGLDATTLLNGRTQTTVNALVSSPGLVDLSQDNTTGTGSDYNYDTTATATSVPVVPTTVTESINKTTFMVRTYIDPCYRPRTGGTCVATQAAGAIRILRVTADVSWPRPAQAQCVSGRPTFCEYFATTLIDPTNADPIFNVNLSPPVVNTTAVSNPSTLFVGQQGTVTMSGSNFTNGATMASSDSTDVFASIGSNNGSVASATVIVGDTGSRVFRFVNPDGSSAVATNAPTGITVGLSSPAVNPTGGVTTSSSVKSSVATITVNGSGFYGSGNLNATPPTIVVSETTGSGATATTTNLPTSGVTLTTAGSATTVKAQVTLTAGTGSGTLMATVTNFDGQMASGSVSGNFA